MRSLYRPIVVVEPNGTIRNPYVLLRSGEPILVYYNPVELHYDALICPKGITAETILAQLVNVPTPSAQTPASVSLPSVAVGNNPYGHFANNSQSTGQTKQEVTTKAETPEVTNQR